MSGIEPMPTSEAASAAGRVRKRRNAPRASTSIWPSPSTNPPGNALANWLVLRPLPTSNGNEKGRGVVCGTQESDRTPSPAPAEIKVCSRAVLPGGGCAKHQAIGPLPQPRAAATPPRNDLVFRSQETLPHRRTHIPPTSASEQPFFNPRRLRQLCSPGGASR